MASKIILVGVGGFGGTHLANLRRLTQTGHAVITALVDPFIKAQTLSDPTFTPPPDAPLFNTLPEALEAVGSVDIVIVCVPIHLHAPITRIALLSGADVMLEKPPFAKMADFKSILALEEETGRKVQVGFQSIGSLALDALKPDGELGIGRILSVRAMGTWLRRDFYWKRAAWVGKRSMSGIETMDGVCTNALAHAVITALHIAGMKETGDVKEVEAEMYRANKVDVDDTTSLRITPSSSSGPRVVAALTLCASEQTFPTIDIVGENGTATLEYVHDSLLWAGDTKVYGRRDLLQNLIEHRRDGTPLITPLRSTGAFMRVIEAVGNSSEPTHIQRGNITVRDEGDQAYPAVQDIEGWVRKAADGEALFSEVGAPWAWAGRDKVLAEGKLGEKVILEIQDGGSIVPTSSPRPYIHPIRTLGGVEITSTHPADHDWHCGLGFAVPDVDGCSFWGGGTFIKGRGYVDLVNHGKMTTERIDYIPSSSSSSTGIDQTILWTTHTGLTPLRELRSIRYSPLPPSFPGYQLSLRIALTALSGPVSLGSPGSNGRPAGGYGGFFWRLPRCSNVEIMSAAGREGEDAVHGVVAPWLSWSAAFEARPGAVGEATIVVVAEESAKADPWVVRNQAYPGLGSAVAWEERTDVAEGDEGLVRAFRMAVLDGRVGREGIERVVEVLQGGDRKE